MNMLLFGQETNFRRHPLAEALKQAGHKWEFPAIGEDTIAAPATL
jgi:hypothetical protein